MLGPTAGVLVSMISAGRSYRALDIGHIDSEYEWFQMRAFGIKLSLACTAEHNFDKLLSLGMTRFMT